MMCPPTHSIAAVPMTVRAVSSFGMPLTRPRPRPATALPERCDRLRPTSSIFTMTPTTP
jgi:hypothetical protein